MPALNKFYVACAVPIVFGLLLVAIGFTGGCAEAKDCETKLASQQAVASEVFGCHKPLDLRDFEDHGQLFNMLDRAAELKKQCREKLQKLVGSY